MTVSGLRAALAADPTLGAGNVLLKLIEHGAPLDGPGIAFDTPVDGHPAFAGLTLGELRSAVAARAAWFAERGVGPRDPVAVYVTTAADCMLHFMALTWLVAIPALMFHRYFKGRIHGYVVEMEQEASALLDTLDGRPGVMNPAAPARPAHAATAKA